MRIKQSIIGSFLILVFVILCLLPTVTDVFIYDDIQFIRDNNQIESLNQIPSFFTSNVYGRKSSWDPLYRPIYMTSLVFNRSIFGAKAFGYHLVNLLLHAIVSILFFHVLARFTGYSYKALIPALLFAVHPIHVDSIAFIHNRPDILALIFLFLGAIFLFKNPKWKNQFNFFEKDNFQHKIPSLYPIIAALFFLLSLFSKESAAPVLIVIVVFFIIKAFINNFKLSLKPFVSVLSIFSLALVLYLICRYLAIGGIASDIKNGYFLDRNIQTILPTVSRVFADYIGLLFLPLSLKISYSDFIISKSIHETSVLLSLFFHIIIFSLAILRMKKNPFFSFCIFSFYIMLLPVSHIFPFLAIKAERFLYIPSIFFCIILTLPLKYIEHRKLYFRIALAVLSALILFYGYLTFSYSTHFKSEISIWQEMVKRSPLNSKAHFNLALCLLDEKQRDIALSHFQNVVDLQKNNTKDYSSLGVSYYMLGNEKEAKVTFMKGLKNDSNSLILLQNFAVFSFYTEDIDSAQKYIHKALLISPSNQSSIRIRQMIDKKKPVLK